MSACLGSPWTRQAASRLRRALNRRPNRNRTFRTRSRRQAKCQKKGEPRRTRQLATVKMQRRVRATYEVRRNRARTRSQHHAPRQKEGKKPRRTHQLAPVKMQRRVRVTCQARRNRARQPPAEVPKEGKKQARPTSATPATGPSQRSHPSETTSSYIAAKRRTCVISATGNIPQKVHSRGTSWIASHTSAAPVRSRSGLRTCCKPMSAPSLDNSSTSAPCAGLS